MWAGASPPEREIMPVFLPSQKLPLWCSRYFLLEICPTGLATRRDGDSGPSSPGKPAQETRTIREAGFSCLKRPLRRRRRKVGAVTPRRAAPFEVARGILSRISSRRIDSAGADQLSVRLRLGGEVLEDLAHGLPTRRGLAPARALQRLPQTVCERSTRASRRARPRCGSRSPLPRRSRPADRLRARFPARGGVTRIPAHSRSGAGDVSAAQGGDRRLPGRQRPPIRRRRPSAARWARRVGPASSSPRSTTLSSSPGDRITACRIRF